MKFNVNITSEHYVQFQRHSSKRIDNSSSMRWKICMYFILYYALLATFVFQIYFFYQKNCCYDYSHLNKALLALAIWFVTVNIWNRIYSKLFFDAASVSRSILGRWELLISEAGISESNDKCSSTFKWRCVESIEKDKHNLYIYTDSLKALIIPLIQINKEIESLIKENFAKYNSNEVGSE